MHVYVPLILSVAAALAGYLLTLLFQLRAAAQKERETRQKIESIEIKAEKEPERTRFAWDLARIKLEAYFDRNLNQVKSIFWVSVAVMIVGFCFILYGIARSIDDPKAITAAYVGAISGIVTELIGATFMVIYRSTMQQASSFMQILERINSVGMAVQILDSISEGEQDLKNATRAELVKTLLAVQRTNLVEPTLTINRRKKTTAAD